MTCIVAIDIGTTHCKAVVADANAKIIADHKLTIVSRRDPSGRHDQDAELVFKVVVQLLQQVISSIGAAQIACFSFSAAMHSLLAVDANGRPLMPAMTWADTRSKAVAQELRLSPGGQEVYANTGTPLHAMSPLCKLIWLRQEQPQLFAAAAKFISLKEYIWFRLFGTFIADEGIASATGLYNIYTRCWDKQALALAGIDESRLSSVVPVTHIETSLSTEAAGLLQLPHPIPFVAGGNDGCMANLGCGALDASVAVFTTGTSGAVRVTIPKPVPGNPNGLFRYLLQNNWYVTGGPVNNGGIILEWFMQNFIPGSKDVAAVLELAAHAPPGANGLLFLPYLLGERAPVWDEEAAGVFSGIKLHHSRADFARAVVEGITFSLLQILHAIAEVHGMPNSIAATGSITQSYWWMKVLSDISGCKVVAQESADASALGAIFTGMLAIGLINDLSEVNRFVTPGHVFEPNADRKSLYAAQYRRFITLYPAYRQTIV